MPGEERKTAAIVGRVLGAGLLLVWAGFVASHVRENPLVLFGFSSVAMLALAALLILGGGRMTKPRRSEAVAAHRPPEQAARTPVPVPPEEIELVETSVSACMRCGSLDVAPLTLDDGLFAGGGENLVWVCRRCHWRGQPVVFDSPTGYRAFVKALHEPEEEA